jgi:hypothetical protein
MDHLVFWITTIGALSLSCLTAAVLHALANRLRPSVWKAVVRVPRAAAAAAAIVALGSAAAVGTVQVQQASMSSSADLSNAARVRHISDTIGSYLNREGLRRPLVRLTQETWSVTAGVYLELAKRGHQVAIESQWIFMFGPDAAANSEEDSEVVIAADGGHPADVPVETYLLIGEWSGVTVRARPLR